MGMRDLSTMFAIGMATLSYLPAQASVIQVFSRSALPSATFDWSSFGPPGTTISTPDMRPGGPGSVKISSSAGTLLIRQEGTDWAGNFAPGDTLLAQADFDRSDSFVVSFVSSCCGAAVVGMGAQIQPASGYYGAFTGILDLYGAGNVFLGEVTVSGISSNAEDNSAPFLGAIASAPIDHAFFSVATGFPGFPTEGDLAINQLSLLEVIEAVPEPAALLLFGSGLLGLGVALRRR